MPQTHWQPCQKDSSQADRYKPVTLDMRSDIHRACANKFTIAHSIYGCIFMIQMIQMIQTIGFCTTSQIRQILSYTSSTSLHWFCCKSNYTPIIWVWKFEGCCSQNKCQQTFHPRFTSHSGISAKAKIKGAENKVILFTFNSWRSLWWFSSILFIFTC